MAAKKTESQIIQNKYFKTIEQMSLVSGIGKNTLRSLVQTGKIDYISVGNRQLIADCAIWDWYKRNKTSAAISSESEEELCQYTAAR